MSKTKLPVRDTGADQISVSYSYDGKQRMAGVSQGTTGNTRNVGYTYGEFEDLTGISHNGFVYKYAYDVFGNVTQVAVGAPSGANGDTITASDLTLATYTYKNNNGSLSKVTYKRKNANGQTVNIEAEKTYDVYGRVTQETLNQQQQTAYTYDNMGNVDRMQDSVAHQLNSYDYNQSGQVVRTADYNGSSATQANLESRMQYTYNAGGQIAALSYQEQGDSIKTYTYTYDADGKPVSITYKQGSNAAVTYFYAYNGQGDVIAIYNSSNSALVGSYEYDLWGKLISVTPASSSSDPKGILTKNPFRYRGYYYDNETGYYYLNARYHDSACAESKPTPSTCLACARMIP